jgi:hypothetical protein
MLNTLFLMRIALSVLRHVATGAGAIMVAEGVADPDTTQQIMGGAVALAGLVFSARDKRGG